MHAGPILVHHTKTLKPFHYFSSTLISYNPSLVNLRAFGTDGEPELAKAFKLSFPNAVHLRCTNHFRQNVKDKLSSIGISQSIWKEYLYDIFGCQLGSHYQKGLIDSASTSCFLDSLQKSKAKWNNLESSCFGHGHCPHFFDWFVKYKSDDMAMCMLPDVKAQAGIYGVGKMFTTNNSESLNHVIKQEVDWKESKLPTLINHLKKIADEHQELVTKTIICKHQFKSLHIEKQIWFSEMTKDVRIKHYQKVQSMVKGFEITPKSSSTPSAHSSASTCSMHCPQKLSVTTDALKNSDISTTTLQGIWEKAEVLLANNHVMSLSWSGNQKDRLVKSSSSDTPHLVKLKKTMNMFVIVNVRCLLAFIYVHMLLLLPKIMVTCQNICVFLNQHTAPLI